MHTHKKTTITNSNVSYILQYEEQKIDINTLSTSTDTENKMNLVKAIIYVRDISGIGKANDRKKQLPITPIHISYQILCKKSNHCVIHSTKLHN